MPISRATVGPLSNEVRDAIAEYRDREGYPNYNEAMKGLLEDAYRDGYPDESTVKSLLQTQ